MEDENLLMRSHLQVGTDLLFLEEVLEWFEQITTPFLPPDLNYECKIAITEGFTNVVRHAHHGLSKATPIDIQVDILSNYIEIKLWDVGQPFDFHKKLHLILNEKIAPLEKEQGRGLILMSKLTDELTYCRLENHRNCLTMRRHWS
ncbi:MAG: ATP-binding protein [Arthrospira sp. PLM2.Bin9]|nr:ATP-binding protein [Arthrospira sp. PLM2.Bin9]TVU54846.1 MAG: ATP-binding protein [Arthrospira sp. PLM2.Bin9]